jgi:deoxyribodipyrimidine photo-lyase
MIIDPNRVIVHTYTNNQDGMVVYRMSRDQRVRDNWALLYAQQLADQRESSLAVVFTLMPHYPNANKRHFDFLINGLKQIEIALYEKNIPFVLLVENQPLKAFEQFIRDMNVKVVVSDFDPLRHKRQWIESINQMDGISHYEVDAHNIVPCHFVSQKVEFGAYTLRPKIKRMLPEFLTEFPNLHAQGTKHTIGILPINWDEIETLLSSSENISPLTWLQPGEEAAQAMLQQFIETKLPFYNEQRNHPEIDGQSNLSPYLHFGHIAAQRIALEVLTHSLSEDRDAFLEELIVRRELADNFCYYNSLYDQVEGFPAWVKKDIELHRQDIRTYLYTIDELESGITHDDLWNAAQHELVTKGKMHGYMRMYWAKKIFEWTSSVEEALQWVINLNDKYSLDGRDPNGYVGVAWSIGGVHDRAWFPRPVFGKVRYMSYSGCKAKFDTNRYIQNNTPE